MGFQKDIIIGIEYLYLWPNLRKSGQRNIRGILDLSQFLTLWKSLKFHFQRIKGNFFPLEFVYKMYLSSNFNNRRSISFNTVVFQDNYMDGPGSAIIK